VSEKERQPLYVALLITASDADVIRQVLDATEIKGRGKKHDEVRESIARSSAAIVEAIKAAQQVLTEKGDTDGKP
jgi:hypothetical protein